MAFGRALGVAFIGMSPLFVAVRRARCVEGICMPRVTPALLGARLLRIGAPPLLRSRGLMPRRDRAAWKPSCFLLRAKRHTVLKPCAKNGIKFPCITTPTVCAAMPRRHLPQRGRQGRAPHPPQAVPLPPRGKARVGELPQSLRDSSLGEGPREIPPAAERETLGDFPPLKQVLRGRVPLISHLR